MTEISKQRHAVKISIDVLTICSIFLTGKWAQMEKLVEKQFLQLSMEV
jgi:hypothetical protein